MFSLQSLNPSYQKKLKKIQQSIVKLNGVFEKNNSKSIYADSRNDFGALLEMMKPGNNLKLVELEQLAVAINKIIDSINKIRAYERQPVVNTSVPVGARTSRVNTAYTEPDYVDIGLPMREEPAGVVGVFGVDIGLPMRAEPASAVGVFSVAPDPVAPLAVAPPAISMLDIHDARINKLKKSLKTLADEKQQCLDEKQKCLDDKYQIRNDHLKLVYNLQQCRQQILQLQQQDATKDVQILQLQQQDATKDAQIAQLQQEGADKDALIAQREQALLNNNIVNLEQIATLTNQHIQEQAQLTLQIQEKESDLNIQRAANAELNTILGIRQGRINLLSREKGDLQVNNNKLQQRIQGCDAERNSLRDELTARQEQIAFLNSNSNPQIQELEARHIKEISEKNITLDKLRRDNGELNLQLTQLRINYERVIAENIEHIAEIERLGRLNTELNVELEGGKSNILQLQSQVNIVSQQLATCEENKRSQIEELQNYNNTLMQKESTLKGENTELRTLNENLKDQIQEITGHLEISKDHNIKLNEQYASMRIAYYKEFKAQLSKIKQLEQDSNHHMTMIERQEERMAAIHGDNERLTRQLYECGHQLRECQEELGRRQHQLDARQQELRKCQEELGRCQQELQKCQEELGRCQHQLVQCQEDNFEEELFGENQKLMEENSEIRKNPERFPAMSIFGENNVSDTINTRIQEYLEEWRQFKKAISKIDYTKPTESELQNAKPLLHIIYTLRSINPYNKDNVKGLIKDLKKYIDEYLENLSKKLGEVRNNSVISSKLIENIKNIRDGKVFEKLFRTLEGYVDSSANVTELLRHLWVQLNVDSTHEFSKAMRRLHIRIIFYIRQGAIRNKYLKYKNKYIKIRNSLNN